MANLDRQYDKTRKSIILLHYQLTWLQSTFPNQNFSEALRTAVDLAIAAMQPIVKDSTLQEILSK